MSATVLTTIIGERLQVAAEDVLLHTRSELSMNILCMTTQQSNFNDLCLYGVREDYWQIRGSRPRQPGAQGGSWGSPGASQQARPN